MRATYRNDEDVARLHIESLLARHRRQVDAIPEHLRRVYARRAARSLAGQVALGGAVLVAMAAAAPPLLGVLDDGAATITLLAAWATSALAYVVGRELADGRLRRALSREIQQSGDVHADRARLEAAAPEACVRGMIDAEERRSVALPLAGAVVLAPLTLHFAIYCCLGGWFSTWSELIEDFDGWVRLSLVLVGHVHAVVAYLAFRHAREIHAASTPDLAAGAPRGAVRALGYAALASLLPGGVLYLIPPLIVLATGAVILPVFALARRRALAERQLIEA
ncbi:hypothetical protein [Sorangium cellulosum]|uniref:Uncharacterized protein n=3 Tax=Sorangium cellulosum TaxID=56 RepID=A0A150TCB3_SORCE|nr:hypothetical protein [Sorangium cellulosum]AGP38952.1 hypothetical protein SCE1572_33375 [Sorangium cellulosum So0157-2]KYG02340.1 hypothetical protein BE21_05380 [Sorangium cellulosum]